MIRVSLYPTMNGNNRVWLLRWHAGGKRRNRTIGKVKDLSRREAEAQRRELEARFNSGKEKPVRPAKMTLKQLLDRDLALIAVDVRPGTIGEYKSAGNHVIKVLGADARIDKIDRVDVSRIKKHLADLGRSKATISRVIRSMRAVFYRAQADGLVCDNVFKGADKGKAQSKPMRIFSSEEIGALLRVCPSDWWRALLRIAFETGLRRNELLNLCWTDINLDGFSVAVNAKRIGEFSTNGTSYPILEFEAKDHETRVVPTLSVETVKMLRRMKEASEGNRYVFLSLSRLAHLGAKRDAGKLRPRAELINNLLKTFQEKIQPAAGNFLARQRGVNLDRLTWEVGSLHDCRKSFATMTADIVPMHVLKMYLGHADISTTARYYLAASNTHAERVRAAFAEADLKVTYSSSEASVDDYELDRKEASAYAKAV